jgi:NitT/TauT family transport system permease protein
MKIRIKIPKFAKYRAYSPAHRLYLRKRTGYRFGILGIQLAVLTVFLGLWELLTRAGVWDSFFVSAPSKMAALFKEMSKGKSSIFYHMGVTLLECLAGFAIATAGGTLVAVGLWWFAPLRKVLEPYIVVLNALPKIALGPILIIWLGLGYKPIIAMTVLICIIVTVISVLNALCAADSDKILLLRSMGAKKVQILFKLILPGSVPNLLSVCKMNIGLAWVGAIMGEYLVSKAGLGYLIDYGRVVFLTDLVMLSTVLLCLMATAMYLLLTVLEKRLCRRFF